MIDRRAFVVGLGAVFAAPRGVGAQQTENVYRVGFLHVAEGSFSLPYLKPALAALGYVEGRNLGLDTRFARGNIQRLQDLAMELVRANVAVILAAGDPAVRAAKAATNTMPIVMAFASLPIEHGFVSSLARPGGNINGVTVVAGPDVDAKRVELLRDIVPAAKTISLLRLSDADEGERVAVERAARALGLRMVTTTAQRGDYEPAFASMKRERVDAVFVGRGPVLFLARKSLIELAAKYGLPAVWEARVMVEEGGLMSYGPHFAVLYGRVASFVDRILKGAKPADLPVEQPTTFELVINRKTAQALNLTVPPSLLLRADQVIE